MINQKTGFRRLLPVLFLSVLASCSDQLDSDTFPTEEIQVVDDSVFDAMDWTVETHSNDADPDFDEVFEDNAVKRLDIVISSTRWKAMLADMTSIYGSFGTRSGGSFSDENPIFVPSEVFYEGKEWYRVGARFMGNSSLQNTWQSGNSRWLFVFTSFQTYIHKSVRIFLPASNRWMGIFKTLY